jgi:hypothetical protein
MELCSENHDEVCYESRRCPVCDVREDLEGSIEDLESGLRSGLRSGLTVFTPCLNLVSIVKELNATKRRLDDCEAMLDERLENERSAEK